MYCAKEGSPHGFPPEQVRGLWRPYRVNQRVRVVCVGMVNGDVRSQGNHRYLLPVRTGGGNVVFMTSP